MYLALLHIFHLVLLWHTVWYWLVIGLIARHSCRTISDYGSYNVLFVMYQDYNSIVPVIQFRNASVLVYNQSVMARSRNRNVLQRIGKKLLESSSFRDNVEKLQKREKYTGDMTKGSRKRLSKAVSLLVTSTPKRWVYNKVTEQYNQFHLSFTTLTIPESEMSKDAKKCHKNLLEPMLRILRRKYGMRSYVWKCELQENGSIHYHLTSDVFLHHKLLRDEWNGLLLAKGYLKRFISKYGHSNPNSTDIHSTRDIRNMEAYIIKYVSKSMKDGKRINAKVWDCSMNLKVGKFFTAEIDSELRKALDEAIKDGECQCVELERCTILKFPIHDYITYYFKHITNSLNEHLKAIRLWERSTKSKIAKSLSNCIENLMISTTKPKQLALNFYPNG